MTYDNWRANHRGSVSSFEHWKQFKIGAVIIKKQLIFDVDEAITNLGVYPTYFVRDLEKDGRFGKLFENRDAIIFRVP